MSMDNFDTMWEKRSSRGASSELKPLVHEVLHELSKESPRLESLRNSMERLLVFLSSDGRTDENSQTVDSIFCLKESISWNHIPENYQLIFEDLGGALHDTIPAPEIAENFDSIPEILLERVRKLSS